MDIVDPCSRKRVNTGWRLQKFTIVTVFASLLKNIPTACEDAVLFESLLKNHHVSCFIF